jgi:type II secretory ATPase GspE/PulE/Tfp pilus assembly ATPase PilB-like protein
MTMKAPTREETFRQALEALSPGNPRYASEVVDLILAEARASGASDVHLQPTGEGLDLRWRIDGVLRPAAVLPHAVAPNVTARLKVLAELLTYKTNVPQEGRIQGVPGEVEMRLSTFPTLYGEKCVIRLFASPGRFLRLDDLGLPGEIADALRRLLGATSGAVILSGPAGSGKTTTIYACLRELVAGSHGQRSLATLEDPVEVAVPGVAQSQVNPPAGFTLEAGLRSLLRQDPEVIAVGEIRDRATAEIAFQASLTGHLVLTTFHAGSAAGVVCRLSDMGIEPYLLRSGILAIISQRLVRRLCGCARTAEDPATLLGLAVRRALVPVGCALCGGTGYRGRMVLAEMLTPDPAEVGKAILERFDVSRLEKTAIEAGMVTRWDRARSAVEEGWTSPAEIRRVLGVSEQPEQALHQRPDD